MRFVPGAMVILIAALPLMGGSAAAAPENPADGSEMRRDEGRAEERSDAAITTELKAKLLADSQLSGFSVDVDTNQRQVVMTGEVPDNELKKKAERLARTVQGVRTISNQLVVTGEKMPPSSERSDTGILTELKAKLFADSELSGWGIDIDVVDREITMTGTVAREELKRKATELAETVAGVKKINNNIQVKAMATSVEGAKNMDDSMIAARIRAGYAADSRLEGAEIRVEVDDGVVTLTGEVITEQQKEIAEDIAEDTEGVVEVENKLKVKEE